MTKMQPTATRKPIARTLAFGSIACVVVLSATIGLIVPSEIATVSLAIVGSVILFLTAVALNVLDIFADDTTLVIERAVIATVIAAIWFCQFAIVAISPTGITVLTVFSIGGCWICLAVWAANQAINNAHA